MISVFFHCSSPYVGFRLMQADYVQEKMILGTEKEMTPIGYKLFNSSGSYMLLGTFQGLKYFHSCESQSENYDEQGRPIHNSVAFLSDDEKDAPILKAIAAYVFFNEEEFYAEMAKYITLLDDGFTVDFKALAAFLKRFEQGCEIQAKTLAAERCFKSIMAADGTYDVDFIVRQSTWNYFIKQVEMNFTKNDNYNLSDDQGRELAAQGTVVFKKATAQPDPEKPAVPEKPAEPEKKAPAEEAPKVPAPKSAETEKKPGPDQETQNKLIAMREENTRQKQLIAASEGKIAALTGELARMKEVLKNRFLTGLAIGIIGTVLAVLIIGQIGGCAAKDEPEAAEQITAVAVIDSENI